jgi:hypothetical protein
MNIWFQMLADVPATVQRLIAHRNRISLPRGASPDIRLERLRMSLCHARRSKRRGQRRRPTYAFLRCNARPADQPCMAVPPSPRAPSGWPNDL